MEKKKLLLIVPKLDQGGLERVCVRTARMLEPYYEVTIAAFDPSQPAYDLNGLRVCDLHSPAVPGKLSKALNVGKRALRLRMLKEKLRPDIAYSFGPTANRANIAAAGPGRTWCGLRSYMDLEKKKELRVVARRSDRLICCSRVLSQEVYRISPDAKTEVLYNPYDAEQMKKYARLRAEDMPDGWEGCKVIAALGREHDSKGFWHLIKAFFLLHEKMPETRLAIVGSGGFTEYRKLARALGIEDAVCMPGLQKNPFPWLLRADLYAACSMYEGFPNAMVEAMTLGTPVVVTNCMTGPAEILTDEYRKVINQTEVVEGRYGILIPPMDSEKNLDASVITAEEKLLSNELYRLLADPEKLKSYAQAAQTRARRYSEEAYISHFLEIAGYKEE